MSSHPHHRQRPRRLVLIRHGESLRNQVKQGRVYFLDEEMRAGVAGTPDHQIPLTDLGWSQARETGLAIRNLLSFGVPDYVYHSGYLRAEQTAQGILEAHPENERSVIRVRANIFMRERDSGFAYDMTEDEMRAAFPWLKQYWDTFGSFMARPPGGESLADVAQRAYLVCNMLFRDRAGQQVFIVTHGGFIRAMRCVLERQTIEEATATPPEGRPKNCSLTVYEFDPAEERLVLQRSNETFWKES